MRIFHGRAKNKDLWPVHQPKITRVGTIKYKELSMRVSLDLELPDDLNRFRLPDGVFYRLQYLLDPQDA